jgi:hypothetical protein
MPPDTPPDGRRTDMGAAENKERQRAFVAEIQSRGEICPTRVR